MDSNGVGRLSRRRSRAEADHLVSEFERSGAATQGVLCSTRFLRVGMRPDKAQHQLPRRKARLPASQSQAELPFHWRNGQDRRQSPLCHESPDVWPRRPDRTAAADSRDSFVPAPGHRWCPLRKPPDLSLADACFLIEVSVPLPQSSRWRLYFRCPVIPPTFTSKHLDNC